MFSISLPPTRLSESLRFTARLKRFETKGQISLINLTKISMALGIADELRNAFTQVPYRNIEEVINERK